MDNTFYALTNIFISLYGIGIGILSISIPYFCIFIILIIVREIAPKEMMILILTSFGVAYSFGVHINNNFAFLLKLIYFNDHDKIVSITGLLYIIPALLSIVQLILCFIKFKKDTPRTILEKELEENALMELTNIYPGANRRMKEYEKLQNVVRELEYQYPTYKEIFSFPYLGLLAKGAFLSLARACGENIIFAEIGRASCRERVYVLV